MSAPFLPITTPDGPNGSTRGTSLVRALITMRATAACFQFLHQHFTDVSRGGASHTLFCLRTIGNLRVRLMPVRSPIGLIPDPSFSPCARLLPFSASTWTNHDRQLRERFVNTTRTAAARCETLITMPLCRHAPSATTSASTSRCHGCSRRSRSPTQALLDIAPRISLARELWSASADDAFFAADQLRNKIELAARAKHAGNRLASLSGRARSRFGLLMTKSPPLISGFLVAGIP